MEKLRTNITPLGNVQGTYVFKKNIACIVFPCFVCHKALIFLCLIADFAKTLYYPLVFCPKNIAFLVLQGDFTKNMFFWLVFHCIFWIFPNLFNFLIVFDSALFFLRG